VKIGVMVESFRLGLEGGLRKAAELGVDGVQIYATTGELTADWDASRRRELRRLLEELGLEVSALCGDFGGHGFSRREEVEWRLAKSKAVMDLAVDLGTRVVTTHIGVVPKDTAAERYSVMKAACEELAEYGEKVGAAFAVETGPETAAELRAFLDSLSARGVRVNYDPANLVMVTHDDPVAGVRTLGDYIVHTHAKDGIHKKDCDPEMIYNAFAEGGIEGLHVGDYFEETPLGEGEVDWPAYVAALKEIGYDGYLTVEREVGEDPVADIAKAVGFLRSLDL